MFHRISNAARRRAASFQESLARQADRRRNRTFTQTLWIAARVKLTVLGGLTVILAGLWFANDLGFKPDPGPGWDLSVVVDNTPRDLVEKNECWTDVQPRDMEGKDPGHVVVSVLGEDGPVYTAKKGVIKDAIEEKVLKIEHKYLVQVHGFCR